MRWVDRINAEVKHIAAGNGFSLISISDSRFLKGEHLFGTGINTQSQIGIIKFFKYILSYIVILLIILGVHETSNGKVFRYIIEPAKIELPFKLEEYKKLKILDIACGRAHSVILTNYGIVSFGK